jgi:hypothetical protein
MFWNKTLFFKRKIVCRQFLEPSVSAFATRKHGTQWTIVITFTMQISRICNQTVVELGTFKARRHTYHDKCNKHINQIAKKSLNLKLEQTIMNAARFVIANMATFKLPQFKFHS